MDEEDAAFAFDVAEQERSEFGEGGNKVTIPLAADERGLLEEIASAWGVSVPVAARRMLLLVAHVDQIWTLPDRRAKRTP